MKGYLPTLLQRVHGENTSEMIQPQPNLWRRPNVESDEFNWTDPTRFFITDSAEKERSNRDTNAVPSQDTDAITQKMPKAIFSESGRTETTKNSKTKEQRRVESKGKSIKTPSAPGIHPIHEMKADDVEVPQVRKPTHPDKSKPTVESISDKSLPDNGITREIKETSFFDKVIERASDVHLEKSQEGHDSREAVPVNIVKDVSENPSGDRPGSAGRIFILPKPVHHEQRDLNTSIKQQEDVIIENLTVEVIQESKPEPVRKSVQSQTVFAQKRSGDSKPHQRESKLRFGLGQI